MKKNEIICKDVMEHICENLGEQLDSPKCTAIKAHLNNCDNCSTYFKTVEDTIQFYKNYNVELPEGAHKRLIEYLGLTE
jgi:predicted anti-sigma-YlaC factor YlaD